MDKTKDQAFKVLEPVILERSEEPPVQGVHGRALSQMKTGPKVASKQTCEDRERLTSREVQGVLLSVHTHPMLSVSSKSLQNSICSSQQDEQQLSGNGWVSRYFSDTRQERAAAFTEVQS